jgi:hypothetical protein
VLHLELSSQTIYLQPEFARDFLYPPLRFAFDHPDRRRLPANAFRAQKEIDEAYAKEQSVLQWLLSDYLPGNPGSRFVSARDLLSLAQNGKGSTVPKAKLGRAVADLLQRWGEDTYPPSFAMADGNYFSLADLFDMLASALSEWHRKDRFPEAVRLNPVYGPLGMTEEHGPNEGTVSMGAVARIAAEVSDRLQPIDWKAVPDNVVPGLVTIDRVRVNAAQFLRLMALAYQAAQPAAMLPIKMCHMFSAAGEMFPRTIRRSEQGAIWTFKPAPLSLTE